MLSLQKRDRVSCHRASVKFTVVLLSRRTPPAANITWRYNAHRTCFRIVSSVQHPMEPLYLVAIHGPVRVVSVPKGMTKNKLTFTHRKCWKICDRRFGTWNHICPKPCH
ncbi:hypothetical protein GQ43DRAFT_283511 [Delitschia confertaspora ATCC 74209]|uniref:Uncharacterized protein n=1 Tax=Delitschia confertaspora ATCC 74209 TaxID=1513339 RepID=A0A9P4JTU7_9PLEO|nr:hypothetical protein GQ43DRAFT_283511 [Delitschia confertaspora ATCC 74209]